MNNVYLPYGDGCRRKEWDKNKKEFCIVIYSCFTCPFDDCISGKENWITEQKGGTYKHYTTDKLGIHYCLKCHHIWQPKGSIKVGMQCPHCGCVLVTEKKFINRGDK